MALQRACLWGRRTLLHCVLLHKVVEFLSLLVHRLLEIGNDLFDLSKAMRRGDSVTESFYSRYPGSFGRRAALQPLFALPEHHQPF